MVLTDKNTALSTIKQRLGAMYKGELITSPERIFIMVDAVDIVAVSRIMFIDLECRLSTVTGRDSPTHFELNYHWAFDKAGCVVTVRAAVDRVNPVIDSIAPLFTGAEWIEREMWELLGITFKHHPDMRHLLLMDEWPEGYYPLRRDYVGPPQSVWDEINKKCLS